MPNSGMYAEVDKPRQNFAWSFSVYHHPAHSLQGGHARNTPLHGRLAYPAPAHSLQVRHTRNTPLHGLSACPAVGRGWVRIGPFLLVG